MRLQDIRRLGDLSRSNEKTGQYLGIIDILETFAHQNEDITPFQHLPMMIGSYNGEREKQIYQRLGWGRMHAATLKVNPYEGEPWGFDNGAWTSFAKGLPFPEERFLKRLDNALEAAEENNAPPLVAVVPDIVGGGMASFEFSMKWIGRLRSRAPDFPWYLVIQNNYTPELVEGVLDMFDGLFLGGGDQMKHAGRRWTKMCHAHGKKLHYGRGGTLAKLQHAFEIDADSIDSAFPLFSKIRFRKFATIYSAVYREKYL